MKICFATHNENKLREVRSILHPTKIVGLTELGQHEEIPETGQTLDENSLLKAQFLFTKFQLNCFADDTGLEVESLNGSPGVYSARYAGDKKDNQANIDLLMKNLEGITNRNARFRTVISLILNGETLTFEGIVNGRITEELSGSEGFGYDPIFIPEGYDITFAQMSLEEKNSISHRGKALKKLVDYLRSTA
ncbi:MAG: XTP/dITP diphosphohydrolase [Cyclobacteriaceae bacterium]|jgi:XTP/dITP diphosphohydrolase